MTFINQNPYELSPIERATSFVKKIVRRRNVETQDKELCPQKHMLRLRSTSSVGLHFLLNQRKEKTRYSKESLDHQTQRLLLHSKQELDQSQEWSAIDEQ